MGHDPRYSDSGLLLNEVIVFSEWQTLVKIFNHLVKWLFRSLLISYLVNSVRAGAYSPIEILSTPFANLMRITSQPAR